MNNLNSFEGRYRSFGRNSKKNNNQYSSNHDEDSDSQIHLNEYMTRYIKEEAGTTPLIFRPPKEIGTQSSVLKIKVKDSNPVYEDEYYQSNISFDLDEENESFSTQEESSYLEKDVLDDSENDSSLKNVSLSLIEKFSSMLEESSSDLDESNSFGEETSFSVLDDSISLDEESSYYVLDELISFGEESSYYVSDESISLSEESTSSILDESISLDEEFSFFSVLNEPISLGQESTSSVTDESISLGGESSYSFSNESISLDEESSSFILDESIDLSEESPSSILDESISLSEESSSSVMDEPISLNEGSSSSILDESTSLGEESTSSELSESSSLEEESSSIHDIPTFLGIHNSLHNEYFSFEESSSDLDESSLDFNSGFLLDQESSCFEESSCIEESSCHENEFSSLLADPYCNNGDSTFENNSLSDYHSYQCFLKTKLPIIKVPVLLSTLDIDVDIFDELELLWPISNVTKIEWSIHSLECAIPLPSNTVFLKGVLLADIEYVNNGLKQSLQSVKIPIMWKKTTNIDWLHFPIIPNKAYHEYAFSSSSFHDISLHREYYQDFSEQIRHELKSVHFVSHDEVITYSESPKIFIHGRARLSIDFLQHQYIDLNITTDAF